MRKILEDAFVALLNEEHDKAEDLFHKFIVEKARQIHETNRSGEDEVLDENWDDEITTESYFTEADLADLEDDAGADEAAAGDEEADADADLDAGDEHEAAADDLAALGDEENADAEAEMGAADPEAGLEDRVDDLEDAIEKMTAEFEAMMDAMDVDGAGEVDADLDQDLDAAADADLAGDVQDDMEDADAVPAADDFGSEDHEEEHEEDFDDITESIIDELEKVKVTLSDGKEIGTGGSVKQNNASVGLQKGKDARQGGAPVEIKATEHKGFERETAPSVKEMPAKKNTQKKANAGQSRVSKEGNKAAEINKLKSDGNNDSLIPGNK